MTPGSPRVLERTKPTREPSLPPKPESFADSRIALLADQGHFDRARVELTRTLEGAPDAASVYLDAVRTELTANPDGEAWAAWVARALRKGAPVAGQLPAIVPSHMLERAVAELELDWPTIARQPARAQALDLWRARCEHLLLAGRDDEALCAFDDEQAERAAADDAELSLLARGVLTACAWRKPDRVAELRERYPAAGPTAEAQDALDRALAHAADWRALPAPPAALDRFARLGALISRERARAAVRDLGRELATHSDDYEAFSEALVARAPRLARQIRDGLEAIREELALEFEPLDPAQDTELSRRLADAERDVRGGLTGALSALPPLRALLTQASFARRLRPRLVRAVLRHRCSLGELFERVERDPTLSRLAAHAAVARADGALSLLSTIAAIDRARP